MIEFTHFDSDGNAIMVDVSGKDLTSRVAVAQGCIKVSTDIMSAILDRRVEKGDVLGVARVAGIMAVKQTSALIPMCHLLPISKCGIEFNTDFDKNLITASCSVKVEGKTGVEMEAMTGVAVALLTIYDMCKAIDKYMEISDIHLVSKSGGKSGEFHWNSGEEK